MRCGLCHSVGCSIDLCQHPQFCIIKGVKCLTVSCNTDNSLGLYTLQWVQGLVSVLTHLIVFDLREAGLVSPLRPPFLMVLLPSDPTYLNSVWFERETTASLDQACAPLVCMQASPAGYGFVLGACPTQTGQPLQHAAWWHRSVTAQLQLLSPVCVPPCVGTASR